MFFIKHRSVCSYAIHNMPSNTTRLLPPTLECAPCLYHDLTLHLIISLHEHERGPIKPLHCAGKYDICSVIYVPNSKAWTQLSSATRYVKKFFDLLNPPRHGSHGHLVEDEKVYLKTSPKSCPCRSLSHPHFKMCGEDLLETETYIIHPQKL